MTALVSTVGCDCIEKVNAHLIVQNGQLARGYGYSHRQCIVSVIQVKQRSKVIPLTMLATYCPFCGVKATS